MLHSNHRPHEYKHPGRTHTFLDHLPSSYVLADPQWSVKGYELALIVQRLRRGLSDVAFTKIIHRSSRYICEVVGRGR